MKKYFIFFVLSIFFLSSSEAIAGKLSGYILLQVEDNGEAWYVNPSGDARYYLGRPKDAFELMRNFGIGITNQDLNKISIGLIGEKAREDFDADGLSRAMEISLGTNPNSIDTDGDGFDDRREIEMGYNPIGKGALPIEKNFTNKHLGKIFLQVEKNGEAWYLNPADSKRYFLGSPIDAFLVMRYLGLGISNDNLKKINKEHLALEDREIEKEINFLINKEREKVALPDLIWNDELAKVAREHSYNLAKENEDFSGTGKACDLPIIHHEGLDFGLYSFDRLNNRNIYYFSSVGENIALIPSASIKIRYISGDPIENELKICEEKQEIFDKEFKLALDNEVDRQNKIKIIENEIIKRTEVYKKSSALSISEKNVISNKELAQNTVVGWMNSPGHKKNILDPEYDETGIGVAWVGDYLISTQVFIKKAECGYINGPCCGRNGCYLPLSCDIESQICK